MYIPHRHAKIEDTYVVSCVRVIIHTTEESSRRVFAKVLSEEVSATGVLV